MPNREPPSPYLAALIAEAHLWLRAVGNRVIEGRHCRFVVNADIPDVWVANHVQHPRAAAASEFDELFAEMDRVFAHCTHRMVMTDGFTPAGLEARLLADGFRELDTTIQMALTRELPKAATPPMDLIEVRRKEDWATLLRLMLADHAEGRRTNHMSVPEHVTRDMIFGLQRKSAHMTLFLARLAGECVAYGAEVRCANGLGMIEDLFTLPSARARGIASALISFIVGRLRADDPSRSIFLGAHASEGAKHLYRRLGFEPIIVTREFLSEP